MRYLFGFLFVCAIGVRIGRTKALSAPRATRHNT